MRIWIKLSGVKDLDLIALAAVPHFDLGHSIANVLEAFASGNNVRTQVPRIKVNNDSIQELLKIRKNIGILLDPQQHKQALKFISVIPKGLRSVFIKNIFRYSLGNFPLSYQDVSSQSYEVYSEPDIQKMINRNTSTKPWKPAWMSDNSLLQQEEFPPTKHIIQNPDSGNNQKNCTTPLASSSSGNSNGESYGLSNTYQSNGDIHSHDKPDGTPLVQVFRNTDSEKSGNDLDGLLGMLEVY